MMNRFINFSILLICMMACSSPAKKSEENNEGDNTTQSETTEAAENTPQESDGDKYEMVINYIDNRAIVYINDSTIYDSKTVNGVMDIRIDLTPYVEVGMKDLKVELYNGKPPYNVASPSWKIVYDIFINDELVEFVSEGERDGRVGLVHTEIHDLDDIW